MSEVWIGRPGDGLLLRPEGRADGSVVWVEAVLDTDGLVARHRVVHHYATGFDELVGFFDGMARDWRGWQGERTFESLEKDLRLTAVHDGHVRLRVTLAQSTRPDGWIATAHLRLEPGEELARVLAGLRDALGSGTSGTGRS